MGVGMTTFLSPLDSAGSLEPTRYEGDGRHHPHRYDVVSRRGR
jgi:hypothetical protein